LQIFNLFSNSYEFLTIDCSLNSFRIGKRLDRTMGHIFQRPNPAVGYVAQQHSSGAWHCVACSRSWLAHGHAGPALACRGVASPRQPASKGAAALCQCDDDGIMAAYPMRRRRSRAPVTRALRWDSGKAMARGETGQGGEAQRERCWRRTGVPVATTPARLRGAARRRWSWKLWTGARPDSVAALRRRW
jgi:hypothetical protein